MLHVLTLYYEESKINEKYFVSQNQKGTDEMKRYLSACWNLMFLLLLLHMDEYDFSRGVVQSQNAEEQMEEQQAEEEQLEEEQIEEEQCRNSIYLGIEEEQCQNSIYLGSDGYLTEALSQQEHEVLLTAPRVQEHEIYSFLQGPRSWEGGVTWSGEWCAFDVDGNYFGGFGCGLCCMANIYSTLSPYEVSPWDMCEYSMSVSNYAPNGKTGAIGWRHMREVLRSCGVVCGLFYKPGTYEEFQRQIAGVQSAIVLVSSREDDSYWKDTLGHYVNIWLYQKEDDTVFLAEPGSPQNNRSRIPLRYVYDALKTASSFQYLAVKEYQEENNQWKADGIDEIWNSP